MTSFQQVLAQKAAAAALQKNPETGANPPTPEEVERMSNISNEALVMETFVPPEGSYRAVRLNQVILANGSVWRPYKGFYIPETEEQKQLMAYYAEQGQGAFVEKVETED